MGKRLEQQNTIIIITGIIIIKYWATILCSDNAAQCIAVHEVR